MVRAVKRRTTSTFLQNLSYNVCPLTFMSAGGGDSGGVAGLRSAYPETAESVSLFVSVTPLDGLDLLLFQSNCFDRIS